MLNTADPVKLWALLIVGSVVMGTFLLVTFAFIRRWQQIRYARYVHILQIQYRPALAKVLAGKRCAFDLESFHQLPLGELELLVDPLFSRRKLTERQRLFLQAFCVEMGLVGLWERRISNGPATSPQSKDQETPQGVSDRAAARYLLRAKSIRNLGITRHRPSWPVLVQALDDPHRDIQLVALRGLAAIGAPESFPALRERLLRVAAGTVNSPPLAGLKATLASFDLDCARELVPLLKARDCQLRLRAMEILRTMVHRKAGPPHRLTLTKEVLTRPLVELLLNKLAVDASAEIRARAAEVIVFLSDPRAMPVLHHLLMDDQWFVRLRAVRALSLVPNSSEPIHLSARQCLHDPHWRVRESAIDTLISLGPEGKHQLYRHFLTSSQPTTRKQIVEVIERRGLMSALVEEYSTGARGVDALMVEHLASDTGSLGLSGVLRTLDPDVRKRFLDRFLPYAEAKMRFMKETHADLEIEVRLQHALQFPPSLVA